MKNKISVVILFCLLLILSMLPLTPAHISASDATLPATGYRSFSTLTGFNPDIIELIGISMPYEVSKAAIKFNVPNDVTEAKLVFMSDASEYLSLYLDTLTIQVASDSWPVNNLPTVAPSATKEDYSFSDFEVLREVDMWTDLYSIDVSTLLTSSNIGADGNRDITLLLSVVNGSSPSLIYLWDTELEVTYGSLNAAPVMNAIGIQTVSEGSQLSVQVIATDANGDALTYSLVDPPQGAAISSTGLITWTPSETQDGTHTIKVQVTDGKSDPVERQFTVTVNEVNTAPVLSAIGNKTVDKGTELTFTATATDSDRVGAGNVPNTLTFSLRGTPPTGASITPEGVFSWTPTQAPGTYPITVRVTDQGDLYDEETINVEVTETTFTVSETGTLTFDSLIEGYDNAARYAVTENVTLSKVGGGAITGLALSFSGGADSAFSMDGVNPDALGAGVSSVELQFYPMLALARGTYTETVTFTADGGLSESFQVSITVTETTFTVSETGTLTFDSLIEGYNTAAVNGIKENITLTKVGNGAISGLAVSFSEGADSAFTTGTVQSNGLGAGVTSTVMQVFPKLGLAPGTYTETVTITADGGLSESFDVSFTVTATTFTVSETGTLTFDSLIEGYNTAAVNGIKENITLTKVGNGAISGLAVSFSEGADSAFTTGTVQPNGLGAGVTSTVMQVFPKLGLIPGTYTETVTITADGGLSESFDVEITIDVRVDAANPTISTQPADVTVDVGDSGSVSVVAATTDGGELSYQWYANATDSNAGGTVITGATSSSYTVPTTAAGTFYYYVEVTNTNNTVNGTKTATVTSGVAEVTVLAHAATPSISTQPADATVDVGDSGSVSVVAATSDSGTLSYQWYVNTMDSTAGGTLIDGATSNSYTVPPTTAGTFYYYVEVTNTNNTVNGTKTATVTSGVAEVTVLAHAATPSISTQPADVTVDVGDSDSVSVVAATSDSGTLSYQWYVNTTASNAGGTLIDGATSSSYTVPTAAAGTFYYYVVVKNTNNTVNGTKTATVTSDVAEVTVLAHAAAPSISTQPADVTVDVGDSSSLSVVAATTDGGTLSYQWYVNATDSTVNGELIDGATSNSYTVLTTAAGTSYYYVIVTNTNNAVNGTKTATVTSDVAEVTVLAHAATPSISTQPADVTVDVGDSGSLSVVAATSDSGELSYQWYVNTTNSTVDGELIDGATSNSYTVPTTAAGTFYYYVIVTNTNNAVNGTKTATVTSDVAEVTVLVHAATPSISTQPADVTVDVGDSGSVSVVAATTDSGTLSYQWYVNTTASTVDGELIDGATSNSYTVPTTAAGTLYYYVEVTNTNNAVNGTKTATVTSDVAEVTVLAHAAAPSISTQPADVTVDVGDSGSLSVVAATSDSGTLSYQWYVNTTASTVDGELIDGATSSSYTVPTTASGTFYYYVVVTNTNNTVNGKKTATVTSDVAEVTVLAHAAAPSISTQPADVTVDVGDSGSVSVVAATSDSGELSYQWYSNTTDSTVGGTLIDGATSSSYTVPTAAAGTFYYYVVVKNTNNAVNGTKTATVTSGVAEVTVLAHAAAPSISTQPADATVDVGDSGSVSVVAATTDGGTLSYQWYVNATDSTIDGELIDGATSSSYTVPTTAAGTFYYYVIVTNTNNTVNGTKTASVTSVVAEVTVLTHAAAPAISTQPADITVAVGGSASLSVDAATSDGGELSYQWYVNTTDSNAGGTLIDEATSSSYTVPTTAAGTSYYYVVVTNTNNTVNGTKTASVTSGVAEVIVLGAPEVAVTRGNSLVHLTWNAVEGAAFYNVYAVIGDEQYELVDTVTTLEYTITNLVNGTTYTFSVQAGNTVGLSNYSTPVHVKPATIPEAPTNVAVSPGNGEVIVTFTIPSDDGGEEITGYEVISTPGSIVATGANNSIVVRGLTNGTAYTFKVRAINAIGSSEESLQSAEVRPSVPVYYDVDLPVDEGMAIIINGKAENAGTVTTVTVNNQKVSTIDIDARKIIERLALEGKESIITIPFAGDSDAVIASIDEELLSALVDNAATIVINTELGTYTLPMNKLDLAELASSLGANPNQLGLRVEIAQSNAETARTVDGVLDKNSILAVAPPIEFKVVATYDGKTVELTKFPSYVQRSIIISNEVDAPKRITTAVVVEADGTIRHVPTKVIEQDNKQHAIINSLTNSTYVLMWNPVQFIDVENHWAKDAINNMGSRLVVNGNGHGGYNPDQDITRAEFAAIIVRGLGIRTVSSDKSFTDVKASDWYYGAIQTAYEYELINGYDDHSFRPNDKITREQAMLIMSKAMKITQLKGVSGEQSAADVVSKFTDATELSTWAIGGVADSVSAGIITGRNNQWLAPKANITRAEVAIIVQRLLQQSDLID